MDGLRVRLLRVADDETVSWREQRAHTLEFLALSGRVSVQRHRSAPFKNSSRRIAGGPELTRCQDGQEGELDVQVAGHLHSSVDRRFRVWEDVALGFSADQYEDIPVMRRGVSNTTAVELGALRHELGGPAAVVC